MRATFIEARYIGLTALLCGPLMVSWVVAGLTVGPDYEDLATLLGLLLTSALASLNMLVLVRNHREDAGYRDGYKQARKLQYFSIFPSKLGESQLSYYNNKCRISVPARLIARSSSPLTSLQVTRGSGSDCFFPEHSQLFFSIFGIRRHAGRSLSQGDLTEDNFKSIEGKIW